MPLIYTNPVWPGCFADPFVLKWQGEYYAYGAGENAQPDDNLFPVLYSKDFAYWEPVGGVLFPWQGR